MKILLSPAKSIQFDIEAENPFNTLPVFLNESEKLMKKLKKLSPKAIKKLMKVSDEIAELNYQRFQEWHLPFTPQNSKAAADIFTGAAYQGLAYPTLSLEERIEGQNRLRILSGLYGILRPLDLIQPYREKLNHHINEELENDTTPFVVNLASAEYFKAVKLNAINYPVVTPIFKDRAKTGDYKVIMTFAKKARGLMSRFIIKNKIDSIDGLKSFDAEGYSFLDKESNTKEFVFVRD